ncbi:MAG TPA: hypothetical protein PLN52_08175 [Opitutaceae bacterium]|nr:hypothetical protein [Opitutaceae bacterium]
MTILRPLLLLLICVATFNASAKESTPAAGETGNRPPASYALKTCIVSDEPLDNMGGGVAYTHSQPGKPDRVVWVCCEGCIDDFKKEPEKYLPKLDQAEKRRSEEKRKP